jgi:hypothetical protein
VVYVAAPVPIPTSPSAPAKIVDLVWAFLTIGVVAVLCWPLAIRNDPLP